VHGDPVRLTHVLANLLNNAAKYTDPGGRIALAVRALPDAVEIAVRDSGVGIAPEALPHVFDMFYQVDGSLGRARGGLGIGLTLVRSLVELHEGSVSVRSEGTGRGSEFVVRLPRVAPPAAAAAPDARGAAAASGRVRVLVADDNRDAADSLGAVLVLSGHEVRVVHDGDAALAAVDSFRPEVCVLDIGMPGRDGHAVAREVRARYGADGPRLVALTGWGQKADQQRAYDAGFDRHLTKPADADLLAAVVLELAADARRKAAAT
jgi:CheY-like chemotaxis protein/anti-sigma regulatory factor (Ser/Thr protein kinase)